MVDASIAGARKIIMGIDPGTNILGYGVVAIFDTKPEYVTMGVLNLKKLKDHFLILQTITKEVSRLIERYTPDEMAVEAPFYGKNPQVMLKLGRAQGAAITAALMKDIPIHEYAPRSVKLAITGKGAASKEQVASMVKHIFEINVEQKYNDATDALAIALCHYYHTTSPVLQAKEAMADQGSSFDKKLAKALAVQDGACSPRIKAAAGGKKASTWAQYVAENPGRIEKGKLCK